MSAVTVVPLYAKPACLRGADLDALDDATSIDDRPFGIVDLGGETLCITIVRHRASGTLRLKVAPVVACRTVEESRTG